MQAPVVPAAFAPETWPNGIAFPGVAFPSRNGPSPAEVGPRRRARRAGGKAAVFRCRFRVDHEARGGRAGGIGPCWKGRLINATRSAACLHALEGTASEIVPPVDMPAQNNPGHGVARPQPSAIGPRWMPAVRRTGGRSAGVHKAGCVEGDRGSRPIALRRALRITGAVD